MTLSIKLEQVDEYISLFKYCKNILISINESTSEYKDEMCLINCLPKQFSYELEFFNFDLLVNSEVFKLIDSSFKNITVYSDPFAIRV